jgi:hypothetical protein
MIKSVWQSCQSWQCPCRGKSVRNHKWRASTCELQQECCIDMAAWTFGIKFNRRRFVTAHCYQIFAHALQFAQGPSIHACICICPLLIIQEKLGRECFHLSRSFRCQGGARALPWSPIRPSTPLSQVLFFVLILLRNYPETSPSPPNKFAVLAQLV